MSLARTTTSSPSSAGRSLRCPHKTTSTARHSSHPNTFADLALSTEFSRAKHSHLRSNSHLSDGGRPAHHAYHTISGPRSVPPRSNPHAFTDSGSSYYTSSNLNSHRTLSSHNSLTRKLTSNRLSTGASHLSRSPSHMSRAGTSGAGTSISRAGTSCHSYAPPFYSEEGWRSTSDNQYPHQLEQERYAAFDVDVMPREDVLFVYDDEPISYPESPFRTVEDFRDSHLDTVLTADFMEPYMLPAPINEDTEYHFATNSENATIPESMPLGTFETGTKPIRLHDGQHVLTKSPTMKPVNGPVMRDGKRQKAGRGTFDCLSPYAMSGKSGIQMKDKNESKKPSGTSPDQSTVASDEDADVRAPELLHSWMLRNLPCKLGQDELVHILDQGPLRNKFNFFFTPVDNRKQNNAKKNGNKKKGKDTANNKGYAFINLKRKEYSDLLWKICENKQFWADFTQTNSPKKAYISPATTQGLLANIKFYKNQVLQAREHAMSNMYADVNPQQAPWFKYSEQAFGSPEEFVLWAAGETNIAM